MESRIAKLEAYHEATMRDMAEMKTDIKEVRKDIKDFIESANDKFAPKKEVDTLKVEVDKQKWAWAWASGFAAAIIFVIDKVAKYFS